MPSLKISSVRHITYISILKSLIGIPKHPNGTMTTTAAANSSAMKPSDLYRNNSSRSTGHASSASARSTGPVDLDVTQDSISDSIDSTVLDVNNTNNLGAAAGSSSQHSHEQNGQYQKLGQSKSSVRSSTTGVAGSNSITSAAGLPASGAGAPESADDVNLFMQNLLEDMVSVYCIVGCGSGNLRLCFGAMR